MAAKITGAKINGSIVNLSCSIYNGNKFDLSGGVRHSFVLVRAE